jgi:hypothetical protein
MPHGKYKPMALAPSNPPIPFHVFISSDSDEFGKLRQDLQAAIDSEYMYNGKRTEEQEELVHQGVVMKGVRVEAESDESFDIAMKRWLNDSQIYVGIFGKDYSIPTTKEYGYACELGLPILVYYFTKDRRSAKGCRSKVVNFLEKEVKPYVRIRGNYSKIEIKEEGDLLDLILADLACKTTDLVREAISTRQLLLGAPDTVVASIRRAPKSVFE